MPDDHSKIIRLEEAKIAFSHELEEVKKDAKRRESKLDDIKLELAKSTSYRSTVCTNCLARLDNLELRVRSLENSKFYWLGANAVIVFLTSLLGTALIKAFV